MTTRRIALSIAVASAAVLSGCTQLSETYIGHDRDAVWTAMVAAAETPDYYPQWTMTENNVWADDANTRIEVDRVLRRDFIQPRVKPRREERHMQFSIYLLQGDEGAPEVEFTSRRLDVPIQAQEEARMYFNEVWDVLGGRPAEEATIERDETVDVNDA